MAHAAHSRPRRAHSARSTTTTTRSFGDKKEFTEALAELQQEGVLTHAVDTDTITLPDVN